MQINIYSQDGTLKATVSSSSGDQCVKELQGDSTLSLSFEYYAYVALEVNDYVDFCGDRYWLLSQYHPAEKSSVSWKYDVTFYGIESLIKRYLVLEHTDGDANPVFSLTAPALQHVNMIVECLNNATGTEMWTVGEVVSTGNITIDYTGKYCDEGLRELAENAETEYWFDGTAVNLCKCERGERLNLAYGDGLISLERDVADGVKFYTRLYPIGSSRNIDPGKYGHSRLQLPNGAKYVDLEVEKYGVVDHYEQEAFSGIYPRYTGTISEVRVESRTDDEGTKFKVYFFKDAGLPFDPNDYLLPNEKMRVSFQSGELHGLGETDDHYFEVDYNSETSEFEIINIWTDGEQLPYGNLVPAVGDTFIPWNIGMPDEYYDLAELEFQEAVANYNQNHFKDISIYRGTTDHVWIESDENTGKEEVELFIGRRVRLVSSQYFPVNGYRDSRITKITRRVDLPSLMDIEISDVVTKGGQERINDSIKSVREYAKSIEGTLPDLVKTGDDKKFTDSNVLTALRSAREFISRLHDDSVHGYITMLKGLQIGANFVPDILGEGGVFRMREDGKVELVTDILYTRMQAYFDSVVIREFRHESGNRIKSPAQGFNASRVEYIRVVSGVETIVEDASEADFFRCYWRVDDGEKKAENQFIIGDLAFCEHSDVVNGSLVTKRYWRVVTGRNSGNTTTADGEAWIDLSNDRNASGNPVMTTITYEGQGGTTQTKSVLSFENGSDVPEAHDDICMLGCVTDNTRQGAIIEYVSGTDAPSYQIYQSIGSDATNPYVLNGKNQITIGYNTATGKADVKVYGDAYIGDRNRSTYMEYKQEDPTTHAPKLSIKAEIEAQSTIGNQSLPDYIKDNQNNYDDTEVQQAISNLSDVTDNLQAQIDGQIESWFYNDTPGDSVLPESEWKAIDIAAGNNNERLRHLGDMYYDNETGYAYRYSNSGTESNPVFYWNTISDSVVVKALADAAAALGLADTKAKIFSTASGVLPTPPYKVNDIWVNATGIWGSGASAVTWENEILKCINAKTANQQASISDWDKASKYTDDSAFNGYINAFLNGSGATGNSATAAAIQKAIASALGSGAVVAGGLLLTSLIGMRQNVGTAENPVYETWGGISGQYDNWSGATHAKGHGIAAWFGGAMVDMEDVDTLPSSYAKSLFRFDGSGYLAGGNITWDSRGRVAIKDITTLIGNNNTNVLNELTTFNNAFHFTTSQGSSTILSISPQAGFTSLSILEDNTLKPVATQEWVNKNYITKTFFNRILKVHYKKNGVDSVLDPNDDFPAGATDKSLESVFSFWTNYALTALGQGQDGSVSYTTLAQLNDVTLTNPTANQILVYDGTHWRNQNQQSVYELPVATTTTLGGIMLGYAASGKNYAIQLDANGKAYVNVPWIDTTYTLPTASADTLGGVKIGTTLAIASGVLNLPTTGVTAGTYKRVTVDAYGRVTSGDNTDIDTNTWRNIYVGGVSKVGTGIDTKAINFKAGSNVSISYVAAGTGSGQSGSANYFDVVISATDTTYSAATQSVAGLMSAADKKKLDGIAEGANKYSLPLAASGTRGGVQIGFTTDAANRNYAVQLSSEKMYVNVPWENTWRGIQNNLTSDSTTDSLSAAQGKALKGYIDTLNSYFSSGVAKSAAKLTTVSKTAWGQTYWTSDGVPTSISGSLSSVTNITMSGYIKIGDAYLTYDSTNNAIRVSANADGTGAMNFYARGGVSALGETADGQAGVGDVTWALLADGTDTRQIALSHLTTSLTTITGGTTDATNKKYAVYKNSSNQLFVDVPWQAGSGTVTSVKVGTTSYTPTNGVISLPAYPTVPTKVSQLTNDSGYITGYTDTKNTAGTTNKAATKLYIVGAESQAANPQTYSNVNVYIGTDNCLYSNNTKVLTSHQSVTNKGATLSWGSAVTVATIGSTDIKVSLPANPNTNTTYTFATGDANGQIKVTPSSGNAYNVSVKGLGSNAYTSTAYLPLSGGTMTGGITCATSGANLKWGNITIHGGGSNGGINSIYIGNDVTIGDCNVAGSFGMKSTSTNAGFRFFNSSGNSIGGIQSTAGVLQWIDSAGTAYNILDSSNSSVSKSGETLTVKINGTSQSLTNTNTTYSASTGLTLSGTAFSINSTYQTYISHGETAYGWGNHANAGYAAASSLGNYLPLSGGTMTGTLKVKTGYGISDATDNGLLCYHPADWTGVSSSQWGVGAIDSDGVIRSSASALKHYRFNDGTYDIIDSKGGQTIADSLRVAGIDLHYTNEINGYNGNALHLNYRVNTMISLACGGGNVGIGTASPTRKLHVAGDVYANNYVTPTTDGAYVEIGNIRLQFDQSNNAIKVVKSDGTAANFYATGGVSALGAGQESGGGGNYLPLSGGTMTGVLTLKGDSYGNNGSLDCNNSDIINVNGIRTADTSDDYTEGLLFKRTNGNYDSFRALDGVFYFGANNGQEKDYAEIGSYAYNLAYGYFNTLHGGSNNNLWLRTDLSVCFAPTNGDSYAYFDTCGTLVLKNTRDADETTWNHPALCIGGEASAAHIEIDNNEILAKSNATTKAELYLGGSRVFLHDGIAAEGGNEINSYAGGNYLYLNYRGGNVAIGTTAPTTYKLTVTGQVGATGFVNTSDIRKKNVIKGIDLRLDQIAKAPAFEYYWLDQSIDHDLHVGTSAQYWQSVLPQVVTTANDEMGTLSMQYGVAALISAITVARKVMTHEEKIALLETRVSALEKENGELIKEIEQLKIA